MGIQVTNLSADGQAHPRVQNPHKYKKLAFSTESSSFSPMSSSMGLSMALFLAMVALSASYESAPPQPPPMDCKHEIKQDDATVASYDLTKLQELSQAKPAVVQDRLQVAQVDFQYTFAVCSTVKAPANCLKADGTSRVDPYWAPAWQTNATENAITVPNVEDRDCMYLGGNGDGLTNGLSEVAHFSALNEDDPAAGVKLTYTHGQHCSNGARRQFIINFKCARVGIEKFDDAILDESKHCVYEISVESEYACPLECGFGGGHEICGGHGVCGFDTDLKKARCFCNEGYSGNGCDAGSSSGDSNGYGPILGLLIFVTIALIGLVAAVVGLWKYMSDRTVPLDGNAYTSMNDGDEEFTPMRVDVQ